ncbi:MAG: hypothetical protein WCY92_13625 [Novosphingobium sp.]
MPRLPRAALALALCGLLAACGGGMRPGPGGGPGGGGPPGPGGPGGGYANPSKVIATDLGFARAAKDRGQWAAFTEYAARDAVLFEPQPTPAQAWLKGRANPPAAVSWQPYSVWSSCDGSLAISQGAWQQAGGLHGRYVTAWARQEDGSYRWTVTQRGSIAEPLPVPDMLDARVASCKPLPPASETAGPGATAERTGISRDRSLDWSVRNDPQCGRVFIATISRGPGESREEVLRLPIAAPESAGEPSAAACPG